MLESKEAVNNELSSCKACIVLFSTCQEAIYQSSGTIYDNMHSNKNLAKNIKNFLKKINGVRNNPKNHILI